MLLFHCGDPVWVRTSYSREDGAGEWEEGEIVRLYHTRGFVHYVVRIMETREVLHMVDAEYVQPYNWMPPVLENRYSR